MEVIPTNEIKCPKSIFHFALGGSEWGKTILDETLLCTMQTVTVR